MAGVTLDHLEAGLDEIRQSPQDLGRLTLIVRRPAVSQREILEDASLDVARGLVGDRWSARHDPDAHAQLTLMNARVIARLTPDRSQWASAGDQLFVDFDLSVVNAPPGTRLAIGDAVIEITPEPHTGCSKFAARFGSDAVKFVNSPEGRALNLRGVNARVVSSGTIRVGDHVRKHLP